MSIAITENNWAMYCDHANEMPLVCPCDEDCGCQKWGPCVEREKRNEPVERDRVDALEERVADLENKISKVLKVLVDITRS